MMTNHKTACGAATSAAIRCSRITLLPIRMSTLLRLSLGGIGGDSHSRNRVVAPRWRLGTRRAHRH